MHTETLDINLLADHLVTVLEKQKMLLEKSYEKFDELAKAVEKNDTDKVEQTLEAVLEIQELQLSVDEDLSEIRNASSEVLECDKNSITAELIANSADKDLKAELLILRKELRDLTEKVSVKHLTTAYLLFETSKINRALIENMFVTNEENITTYSADGVKGITESAGLLDTEH